VRQQGLRRRADQAMRICVPATGWAIEAHQPAALVVGLKLCEDCAGRFDGKQFLRDNQNIREIFEILLQDKPDFERAFAQALPLDHPDVLMLERGAQRAH
jgi:hypothetical protein